MLDAASRLENARELIATIPRLALARSLPEIQTIVRTAARRLTGADGATFVLRDTSHCFYADEELLTKLESAGQVLLRYEPDGNPNGSVSDIAGVVNDGGNVLGLMPHPEHAVDPLLGSADGGLLLASLVDAARESLYASA